MDVEKILADVLNEANYLKGKSDGMVAVLQMFHASEEKEEVQDGTDNDSGDNGEVLG